MTFYRDIRTPNNWGFKSNPSGLGNSTEHENPLKLEVEISIFHKQLWTLLLTCYDRTIHPLQENII